MTNPPAGTGRHSAPRNPQPPISNPQSAIANHQSATTNHQSAIESLPTPCYLYSAPTIRRQYARLAGALPGYRVLYSLKANPNPAIVALLLQQGAGAEVSSRAELETALAAGCAPDDIVYVAPAKPVETVRRAVEAGIHAIVCDCPEDLVLCEAAAREAGRKVRLLLRINTDEKPTGREKMVGGPSKFGFDEEDVLEQARRFRLEYGRIAGIQVYSSSQVLDAEYLASHFHYVADLALRLAAGLGCQLESVDFGGGFGLPYGPEETGLDLGPVGAAAAAARSHLPADCRLLVESGRFLVAEAGLFLTRVVRVKRSRGKTIVITDGGMNAFSRPVVMRIQHQVRLLARAAAPPARTPRPHSAPCSLQSAVCNHSALPPPGHPATLPPGHVPVDICGPICTPIDCLARDVQLPEPGPGDILGFENAGAYGFSMSLLGFMSLDPPAEYLLDNDQLRPITPARG